MDDQQTSHLSGEKFTWRIENFSKLKALKLYSKPFNLYDYQWRILVYPKGNGVDHLSLYLDAKSLPAGSSKHVCFRLAVINQVNMQMTIEKDAEHSFNSRESDWGFTSFVPLSELHDPKKGYIVKDTCIIIAEISIPNPGNENQTCNPLSQESGDQTGQMEVEIPQPAQHTGNPPLPAALTSNPIDELSDIKGLGKIESVFVPLLEEVCSKHPSLLECQQKRSGRFVEWAFTALGRVLHFLKTKKVKDMNDEACEHLQIIWEELETFRFDLTWLEPHVKSALGMNNYLEKAMRVKKLKDNVSALEMEMKRLKAKLAAAEIDLEIAKRNLAQAEEGFEERDLDADLGYGRP